MANSILKNNCVMADLIGKTVRGLAISQGEDTLVVTHDEGRSVYVTDGDCCSETWFADIIGVANLIGHKVLEAEDVELPDEQDDRTRQECDSFYGIKLTTTRGYVDIVYRNSSNGYYGGSIYRAEEPRSRTIANFVDITDDFSA